MTTPYVDQPSLSLEARIAEMKARLKKMSFADTDRGSLVSAIVRLEDQLDAQQAAGGPR